MNRTIYKRYNLELVEEGETKYVSTQLDEFKNKKISSTVIAGEVNKVFNLNKKAEEYIILLCLDNQNYINGIFEISHGGISSADYSISNILKRALLVNSKKIIVCHNHPSGNLNPSKNDCAFTDRLYNASSLLGIELLDHIIIGHNNECNSILKSKVGVKV